jgi:hypothetical protein
MVGNTISAIRMGPNSTNPNSFFTAQIKGDAMATARSLHTAITLPDGKILIAGGYDQNYQAVATAELYDPATGSFAPTGAMHDARIAAAVTQLSDGRVLHGWRPGQQWHCLEFRRNL